MFFQHYLGRNVEFVWFCLSGAILVTFYLKQNKLGLDEVPTLNYGGKGGEGSGDDGGSGAAEAPAEKTLWKVKVTGFGEKAKIKVCAVSCVRLHTERVCCAFAKSCCSRNLHIIDFGENPSPTAPHRTANVLKLEPQKSRTYL